MERLQEVARALVAWWHERGLLLRGGLLGGAGLLLGTVVATAVLAGGSSGSGDEDPTATPTEVVAATVTATPSATATATRTPRPTRTATATATPEPTPTAEPAITNIGDLVSEYGYPAGYNFARIRIPSIGVDAPVGASHVNGGAGAEMGTPEGPATVLWYDMSEWPGLGGEPGAGGNAIFSGHVDLASYVPYAGVNYSGPAVFYDLKVISAGDHIFVDYAGQTLEYVVVWREQIPAGDGTRWGQIWSADVPTDSITLYTCGGDFDSVERAYTDRIVVRAERA